LSARFAAATAAAISRVSLAFFAVRSVVFTPGAYDTAAPSARSADSTVATHEHSGSLCRLPAQCEPPPCCVPAQIGPR
jgi:hypothetical protein